MPADFWRCQLKINFNDTARPEDVFVYEGGFTETYFMPIGNSAAQVRTKFRNLIAARCALLAANFYVFSAGFSQASVFGDNYPVPGYPTQPVSDSIDNPNGLVDFCNDVQQSLLIRFEGNMPAAGPNPGYSRRWERVIRGIKDYWEIDESTRQLVGTGFGNGAFDNAVPLPQDAPAVGADAVFSVTVAGGSITAASVVDGGSGYNANGNVALVAVPFAPPDGVGSGGSFDITIVGGIVTAITINTAGSGYTNVASSQTVFTLPFRADPFGISQFQSASAYFLNYCSCLQSYCINFNSIRVDNATFPSGKMTQINTNTPFEAAPYQSTRFMLQRFTNRQTGRINTVRKARRKYRV